MIRKLAYAILVSSVLASPMIGFAIEPTEDLEVLRAAIEDCEAKRGQVEELRLQVEPNAVFAYMREFNAYTLAEDVVETCAGKMDEPVCKAKDDLEYCLYLLADTSLNYLKISPNYLVRVKDPSTREGEPRTQAKHVEPASREKRPLFPVGNLTVEQVKKSE